MTVLDTNKPVWFDKEGGLLNEGYIYVGEPNKAPQDFPVTVTFEDSSGNQVTAAQPLRTDASGRIVYLGNATIATVAEDYSLLILDSAQKQQDYIPSVDAGIITGSVDAKVYSTQAAAVADQTLVADMFVQTLDKTTPFDGDGADWRVVAYTGTPGDGIDLVDLDNGLQLKRLKNYLAANKNLEEIEDAGAIAQQAARENLGMPSPDVSNYIRGSAIYRRDYTQELEVFVGTVIPNITWQSIGPTGSGADHVWADLDSIPLDAKMICINVKFNVIDTGGSGTGVLSMRPSGSTLPAGDDTLKSTSFANTDKGDTSMEITLPVNSSNVFEAYYNLTGVSETLSFEIRLEGFVI
jgi:hypothetical protein